MTSPVEDSKPATQVGTAAGSDQGQSSLVKPVVSGAHRGRCYSRRCCVVATVAAVTAAVAGVAFQLYGNTIMGEFSKWTNHTV